MKIIENFVTIFKQKDDWNQQSTWYFEHLDEQADADDYDQYADAVRAWDRAAAAESRRLFYVDDSTRQEIAAVDRICGPARWTPAP